jgi:hypothetical protein
MKWTKKTAKIMLTVLVVALVGRETQLAIQAALNMEQQRQDFRVRNGRSNTRGKSGFRNDGLPFEEIDIDDFLEA